MNRYLQTLRKPTFFLTILFLFFFLNLSFATTEGQEEVASVLQRFKLVSVYAFSIDIENEDILRGKQDKLVEKTKLFLEKLRKGEVSATHAINPSPEGKVGIYHWLINHRGNQYKCVYFKKSEKEFPLSCTYISNAVTFGMFNMSSDITGRHIDAAFEVMEEDVTRN